jgi:glycosyltransferase involved in cell wall biosynthesis
MNVDSNVNPVFLAGNYGHQNAILAGYTEATGDCICSIDADLQDPPELIEEMLQNLIEGADLVKAVRHSRDTDSFFKRVSARSFYRLMRAMGVNVTIDHADYRLFTREVRDAILEYSESNLFLRALFNSIGFRQAEVYFSREHRKAGTTKYPMRKMIELAINGITSYSILPLRLTTILGLISSVISSIMLFWSIYVKLVGGAITGWTSTVSALYFLGSVQLVFLGIMGEYIGKIYLETKKRPRYLIRHRR